MIIQPSYKAAVKTVVKPRKPANKVTIFQFSALTGLTAKPAEAEEEEEELLAAATLAVWTKEAEEAVELAIVNECAGEDIN